MTDEQQAYIDSLNNLIATLNKNLVGWKEKAKTYQTMHTTATEQLIKYQRGLTQKDVKTILNKIYPEHPLKLPQKTLSNTRFVARVTNYLTERKLDRLDEV